MVPCHGRLDRMIDAANDDEMEYSILNKKDVEWDHIDSS